MGIADILNTVQVLDGLAQEGERSMVRVSLGRVTLCKGCGEVRNAKLENQQPNLRWLDVATLKTLNRMTVIFVLPLYLKISDSSIMAGLIRKLINQCVP